MTEEIVRYDENGNKIYSKYSNGCELWYDAEGFLMYSKGPDQKELIEVLVQELGKMQEQQARLEEKLRQQEQKLI